MTWRIPLVLCSISQDCIPLLGFKTRFSFELILCNQLLMSKAIFALLQAWTARQETTFLHGASKLLFFMEPQNYFSSWSLTTTFLPGASHVSYILGYNGKNTRLKVSCKWFLKYGPYCISLKISDIAKQYIHLYVCLVSLQCREEFWVIKIIHWPYLFWIFLC